MANFKSLEEEGALSNGITDKTADDHIRIYEKIEKHN